MNSEYKISMSTKLNPEAVIKKIFLIIERRKYGILEIAKDSISFDDYSGGFISKSEYFTRLKSGKFKIENKENYNIVVFEYLPIPISEYIFVIAVTLFITSMGLINHDYRISFISLPFIGQLIFKYYNLKKVTNDMLTEAVR